MTFGKITNALTRIVEAIKAVSLSIGGSPIGAYAGATTYQKGDIVSYTDGSSYIAKTVTVGNLPTNTTYWVKLAQIGATGASGGTIAYAADAGASDAYAITIAGYAAYVTGDQFCFKANTINTGAATLNINTLGAKTIKKNKDQDLADGDIKAGQDVNVVYDGTNFQMQSQLGNGLSTGLTSYSTLNLPEGFLVNGKIVPSVTSNNLTVAIKGMDGNDPSASNPVYCRINGVVRAITAALSVTKNAGSNWFGSGGTFFATKEMDYFVYLGYNATDGVVLGFARVPFGTQYDSFSTTTTNEKYCAISTITTAASTDYYHVIGRFAATLSATAAFNWSVPTFTSKNLIQRPIWNTRKTAYVPIVTWNGTAPTTPTLEAYFMLDREQCRIDVKQSNTGAGVGNTQLTFDGPLSASVTASEYGIAGNGIASTAIIGTIPDTLARTVGYGTTPNIYLFFSSIAAKSFTVNISYPTN